MERILELRADAFADDVDVSQEMLKWTEERIMKFFENGGEDKVCDEPLPPLTRPLRVLSLHGGGGNKNVNMVQTSALRSALGPIKAIHFDLRSKVRPEEKAKNTKNSLLTLCDAGL